MVRSVEFVVHFGKNCVHKYMFYIYKININIRNQKNVILKAHWTYSHLFIVTFLKIDFFFFRSRSHSKNPKRYVLHEISNKAEFFKGSFYKLNIFSK